MRTQRMTILLTPDEKAGVEASAGKLGISRSEYVRMAVDNFETPTAAEEAELAALLAEVNRAVPKMQASIERTCATLDATHRKVDAFLRDVGVRP